VSLDGIMERFVHIRAEFLEQLINLKPNNGYFTEIKVSRVLQKRFIKRGG
jgi:hypothetical protein